MPGWQAQFANQLFKGDLQVLNYQISQEQYDRLSKAELFELMKGYLQSAVREANANVYYAAILEQALQARATGAIH